MKTGEIMVLKGERPVLATTSEETGAEPRIEGEGLSDLAAMGLRPKPPYVAVNRILY